MTFGVCICSILFILTNFFYASIIKNSKRWLVNKSFYFLVKDSNHIEASAEQIELQGGAAYLLRYEGIEYATFSVYFTEEVGKEVQALIDSEQTKLICVSIADMYFKTRKEKGRKEAYQGAFRSLDGCLQALNGVIERLEKGGSQESAKRLLLKLKKQFDYLSNTYKKIFPRYTSVCQKTAREIEEINRDIVYVKDLRYLLCFLADAYVTLGRIFSL